MLHALTCMLFVKGSKNDNVTFLQTPYTCVLLMRSEIITELSGLARSEVIRSGGPRHSQSWDFCGRPPVAPTTVCEGCLGRTVWAPASLRPDPEHTVSLTLAKWRVARTTRPDYRRLEPESRNPPPVSHLTRSG